MAESNRSKKLQAIAGRFPAANERVAQGQQAARAMQVQQAARQAPRTKAAAQQVGATSAAQSGAIAQDQARKDASARTQVGQLGLAEQGRQQRARTFGLQQSAQQEQFDLSQELAKAGENAKQELFDDQMQFNKDEAGRTYFNERQLLDWKATNAESDQEYKDTIQEMNQIADRKIQIMEQAAKVLHREMEQEYKDESREMAQARKRDLAVARQNMKREIQAEQARIQSRNAMIKGAFTIGGAGLGALVGNPLLGAAIGGGLSSIISGATQ